MKIEELRRVEQAAWLRLKVAEAAAAAELHAWSELHTLCCRAEAELAELLAGPDPEDPPQRDQVPWEAAA